jgi:hypothetical protein
VLIAAVHANNFWMFLLFFLEVGVEV